MNQTRLNAGDGKSGFSPLLQDLNFIKRHRRYPINKHTRFVVIAGASTVFFSLLIIGVFLMLATGEPKRTWFLPTFFTIVMLYRGYATVGLLRFRELKNPFNQQYNILLLKQFLIENQLAFFQSPLAAEVFQIASRPLSPEGGQREIMVFIADEQRILLNSHFTNPLKEGIPLKVSLESKKMETALRRWISEQKSAEPEHYFHKLDQ